MDLGIIVVAAIIVAICLIPFILLRRSMKRPEKQLLQSLSTLAAERNATITQHEYCGGFVIGLDEVANILFFLKHCNGEETSHQINLLEIRTCKVVNTSRTIKNKSANYLAIDKLELCFSPVNKAPDILLEFYNAEESLPLDAELEVAERWARMVNDRLKVQIV